MCNNGGKFLSCDHGTIPSTDCHDFFLNSSGDRFCQTLQISIGNRGLDLLSISEIFLKCGDQPVVKIYIESVPSPG
jgi:hypothetical protein